MGPQNGIVGDDYGTELPETQVPEQDITRELNMAKFSRTAEFKVLKKFIQSRIDFHQRYIPGSNGSAISLKDLNNEERGWRWLAADTIIEEFLAVINAYETADEVVKNAASKRTGA